MVDHVGCDPGHLGEDRYTGDFKSVEYLPHKRSQTNVGIKTLRAPINLELVVGGSRLEVRRLGCRVRVRVRVRGGVRD
jgi:hypothetical protein